MPKSNPFYHYINNHRDSLMQSKTDRHGSEFLTIPLAPTTQCRLDFDELTTVFTEHHVTVYASITEDVGYNSLYHYTATCKSITLRVYFNEYDDLIKITVTNNHQQKSTTLTDFTNDTAAELLPIKQVIEQEAQPIIQNLHAQHSRHLHALTTEYIQQLEIIHQELFDHSEAIKKNLGLILNAIKKGKALEAISYQKNLVRKTLPYLEACQRNLSQELASTSLNRKSLLSPQHHCISSKEAPGLSANPTSKPSAKQSQRHQNTASPKTVATAEPATITAFEQAYSGYLDAWGRFTDCSEISQQIELFAELGESYLPNLNGAALELLTELIEPSSPKEHSLIQDANLGVTLFQAKYTKTGVNLLLTCLQGTQTIWLRTHEKLFKSFANMLSHEQMESLIRHQNVTALTFLLKHRSISIHHYLIPFKKGPALSPLCAAYKYGNLALFELFLEHRLSSFAPYETLPLAHTLLQLKTENKFYQLYLQHCQQVMTNEPRFYQALASAVSRKLEDPELDASQQAILSHAHADYLSKSQNNSIKLSKSGCNNMAKVRKAMNPETLDQLREMPLELSLKFQELNQKANELNALLNKRHQGHELKNACEKYYQNARKIIDNQFEFLFQDISIEDIAAGIDEQITQVTACLSFYELKTKSHLSKRERQRMQEAFNVLMAREKTRSKSEQLIETIENIPELHEEKAHRSESQTRMKELESEFKQMLYAMKECVDYCKSATTDLIQASTAFVACPGDDADLGDAFARLKPMIDMDKDHYFRNRLRALLPQSESAKVPAEPTKKIKVLSSLFKVSETEMQRLDRDKQDFIQQECSKILTLTTTNRVTLHDIIELDEQKRSFVLENHLKIASHMESHRDLTFDHIKTFSAEDWSEILNPPTQDQAEIVESETPCRTNSGIL